MSKLKLDLDALVVTSFAVGLADCERGTVHGRAATFLNSCRFTCNPFATCNCPLPTAACG